MQYRPGDRVIWQYRDHAPQAAEVIKINFKSVTISWVSCGVLMRRAVLPETLQIITPQPAPTMDEAVAVFDRYDIAPTLAEQNIPRIAAVILGLERKIAELTGE